jgi:hypothetical protein
VHHNLLVLQNKLVKRKTVLLLDDLLQRIDDTIFDNPLANQHRFHYFDSSDNEDDEMLDLNEMLDLSEMINVDDKLIPLFCS